MNIAVTKFSMINDNILPNDCGVKSYIFGHKKYMRGLGRQWSCKMSLILYRILVSYWKLFFQKHQFSIEMNKLQA